MSENVSLRQTTIQIKICPPGEPTRLTTMQATGHLGYYPYGRADVLTFKPVRRRYRALVVENRFLRAVIIPDLGAHLYSLYDRVNKRQCFVCPPVIKYGRVHLRGAWGPLGIECNFPRGHTVSSSWPVQWSCRRGSDGEATISIAAYHWCTRMHWEADFTLKPDDARLHVHTRLSNPTDVPYGFMYWANAAVWMSQSFRMQVRATMADVAGEIIPFPVYKGRDWTWYRNRPHSSDLFAIAPGQSWFAGYDYQRRQGVMHVADPKIMPGKKFFSWGCGDDGLTWGRVFATEPEHYGELQAGLADNQGMVSRFEPGSALEFDELWYPFAGLGDVAIASDSMAAGVSAGGGSPVRPELRLFSALDLPEARVEVKSQERTLLAKSVRLAAGRCEGVVLPVWPDQQPLQLAVRCGRKMILAGDLRQLEQADEQQRRAYEQARLDAEPKDPLGKARRQLDRNMDGKVQSLLGQARRQKLDSLGIALENANFCLRRFRHQQAWAGLQRVSSRRRDSDWQVTAGDVLTRLGRLAAAAGAYRQASKSKKMRARALTGLARCQAAQGELGPAIATADRLVREAGEDAAVRLLRARLLRHMGRTKAARAELERVEQLAPALPGLDVERWLLTTGAAARRAAWRTVLGRCAGQADYFLEIAWDLVHLGLGGDAVGLLEAVTCESLFAGSPMPLLTLAWWLRDDQGDRAEGLLDRAAGADWAEGTPHRWESRQVLDWAGRRRPDSGRIAYWRGCLANRVSDEAAALRCWRRAIEHEPGQAGARRNLGYTLANKNRIEEAWDHYRVALKSEPDEPHLIEEAQRVLCRLGRLPERVSLLRKSAARQPKCDKIVRQLAVALRDVGRYQQAIEVMQSIEFSPWEGECTLRHCYNECRLALARLALKQGKLDEADKQYEAASHLPVTLNTGHSAKRGDAHSLYGRGLVAWARGQTGRAYELWEEVAGREYYLRWAGTVNSPEPFCGALANRRIGRAGAARELAEKMVECGGEFDPDYRKRDIHGQDTYRWAYLAGLGAMVLGRKRQAVRAFEDVLDIYGPHDATVGRLSLIDSGKWRNRGAFEIDWLGMAL